MTSVRRRPTTTEQPHRVMKFHYLLKMKTIATALRTQAPIIRTSVRYGAARPTLLIHNPLRRGTIVLQKMPLVTINQSLRESLKKHEIIPDVLDDFTPTSIISAKYPTSGKEVSLGNTLQPDEAQEKPQIQIMPEGADENSTYTLVMTDPDAPSRDDPKWSEFCHWIITNVKTTSLEAVAAANNQDVMTVDFSGAKEIIEYMGPAPPEGTGKHRYVLVLFRGGGDDLQGPSERKKWGNEEYRQGVRKWAKKNDLTPVGANFYFSETQ